MSFLNSHKQVLRFMLFCMLLILCKSGNCYQVMLNDSIIKKDVTLDGESIHDYLYSGKTIHYNDTTDVSSHYIGIDETMFNIEVELLKQIRDTFYIFYLNYEKIGDYQTSLFYKEKYSQINDSLDKGEWERNIVKTKKAYEQRALTDTLDLLHKEYLIDQLNHKKEVNKRIAIISFISLGIIMISVYLHYYRKKLKAEKIIGNKTLEIVKYNEELEEKNKLLEIQKREISEQNRKLFELSSALDEHKSELEKFSYIAKFVSNAIIITDLHGIIIWANNGFQDLCELSSSQSENINGSDIREYFGKEIINNIISKSLQTKSSQFAEIDFEVKGCINKSCFTTITPCVSVSNSIDKLIFVNSDIYDLKIAKKRLEVLNENLEKEVATEVKKNRSRDLMIMQQSKNAAMGEMVSNIAHQWRQPLSAISIIVQNLQEVYVEQDLTEDYLKKTIEKSTGLISYMSQTIDDFRNFFNTDKEKSDFSIVQVVEKALSFLSMSFSKKRITVNKILPDDIRCNGFPNEYLQVVINILSNAKEALVERDISEAEITIVLKKEHGKSLLSITDNAGGIEPKIISKIFNLYFSTKKHKSGTGLGLYMSKYIVEKNMNGKLFVENTKDGACFSIIV